MSDFFSENASAVFALGGAFGGGLLSFLGAWLLKRRDLQLHEKITDRRLASHDAVLSIAKDMRKTGIPYDEATSVDQRAPICFCTLEDFDRFNVSFAMTMVEHSTWLSAFLVRELHLLQDYLANVQIRMREVGKDKTFELGCLLREDFIDFSMRIERLVFDYYARLERLDSIKPPSDPHYPKKERDRRLDRTKLVSRHEDIMALRHAS